MANYSEQYLTIVSLADNNVISWESTRGLTKYLYISEDGKNWNTNYWVSGAGSKTLQSGDKLYIKCMTETTSYATSNTYCYFKSTSNFNVEGNIMSLIYGDNFRGKTNLNSVGYNFKNLFYNCTKLISAENLVLPATTLATYCYYGMFSGCTSLVIAPKLPATKLAEQCYREMFNGCNKLKYGPELSATTLSYCCCQSMFSGCTSLVEAPELHATTLAKGCYWSMFEGCTSLVKAPELPATTLAEWCYEKMFYRCSNLKYIKCLATNRSATDCTANWTYNVASTGTFIKANDINWAKGTNGIPSTWEAINIRNVINKISPKKIIVKKFSHLQYETNSPINFNMERVSKNNSLIGWLTSNYHNYNSTNGDSSNGNNTNINEIINNNDIDIEDNDLCYLLYYDNTNLSDEDKDNEKVTNTSSNLNNLLFAIKSLSVKETNKKLLSYLAQAPEKSIQEQVAYILNSKGPRTSEFCGVVSSSNTQNLNSLENVSNQQTTTIQNLISYMKDPSNNNKGRSFNNSSSDYKVVKLKCEDFKGKIERMANTNIDGKTKFVKNLSNSVPAISVLSEINRFNHYNGSSYWL